MTDALTVTLVQQVSSLDPAENRALLASMAVDLDSAAGPSGGGLVVLPEAFARDFGRPGEDVSAFAEDLADSEFVGAVEELAVEGRTVVAGMFERSEDPARPYNTLIVRGAAEASYRKVHLYDSFGYRESDRLLAGEWRPTVVDIEGFRVGLMTCYDLRFPELARALVDDGADLIVVPAAWVPGSTENEHARKIDHWRTLLRARAIESTVYVAGVGQPAPRYTGHSMLIGPMGECVLEMGAEPAIKQATIRRDVIEGARRTNPSLANRRHMTSAR